MSTKVKIAAACIEVGNQPQDNLAALLECIAEAAAQEVALLVLPECALQGYPDIHAVADPTDAFESHLRHAEPVPGPATQAIAEAAGAHAMEIIFGLSEAPHDAGESGRLYNTAVVVDGDGVRARYRKIHTGGREKCLWNRGREWVVADTVAGRMGLIICYDLVFPEPARALALAGAGLIAMPTAWGNTSGSDQTFVRGYDLFTRARALENQVYLVSANLVGGEGDGYYGHSRIVDPRGEVIAETEGPGLATAAIDVAEDLIEARAHCWLGQVFLKDREPSTYGVLL